MTKPKYYYLYVSPRGFANEADITRIPVDNRKANWEADYFWQHCEGGFTEWMSYRRAQRYCAANRAEHEAASRYGYHGEPGPLKILDWEDLTHDWLMADRQRSLAKAQVRHYQTRWRGQTVDFYYNDDRYTLVGLDCSVEWDFGDQDYRLHRVAEQDLTSYDALVEELKQVRRQDTGRILTAKDYDDVPIRWFESLNWM